MGTIYALSVQYPKPVKIHRYTPAGITMNIHTLYKFMLVHASKLTIVVLAALAGELTEIFDKVGEHPGLLSIGAGIITALTVKYVDKYFEGRNKTIKTADEVLKIEDARRLRLEAEQKELLDDKEAWYKLQGDREKAQHYERETRYRKQINEAGKINHKAINQIMTQQNVILGMQREMVLAGLQIPAVSMLEITEFMIPIWEEEALHESNKPNKSDADTEADSHSSS